MIRRIWSLVIKEVLHLLSDWWMPAFMLLGGATELLLVGWATSRPITNLPLMVLDHDQSAESRRIVAALENTDTFTLEAHVTSLDDIQDALDRGQVNAALLIPPDFGSEMEKPRGEPRLSLWVSGAESIPAKAALEATEGVVSTIGQGATLRKIGLEAKDMEGFDASLRVWFNEELSEALYTTPAELGLMLEFTILLFAALSFARERELGTLEQLLVMPFSSLEIVVGKAIPVILIGFCDFLLMLGGVHLFFGVPVRGSLPLLLILAAGYLMVELSKGLVISVISRTQHQAFLLVMMVGMTDFMFTGYAAPVESMPRLLQLIANVIPAHHWLIILRDILLKGAGMEVLWPNVLALGILGSVIGASSLYYVRRALD